MFNSNKARRGNQLKLLGNFSVIRYLGAVCHRHVHDGMLSLMERRSCNNPTRKFSPRGTTKQTLFQAKIVEVSRTHVMQPTKTTIVFRKRNLSLSLSLSLSLFQKKPSRKIEASSQQNRLHLEAAKSPQNRNLLSQCMSRL
jgi:hypothetical protein